MKSFELKISLTQKKKRIMRTLLVSKNTTYENLHEMIQILFNLDCCESYCFEVNKKFIQVDKKHNEKKTLVKNQDVIYYHYDLVEPLRFKIEMNPINQIIDTPVCIKTVGKHLYEGLNGQVESKYQGNVEMDWINTSLSYFNENKQKEFFYEVKNLVKELSSIRFFQDYMHNQIVQIRLPQNKTVFMACDASEDVVLNFHINANKLLEYTCINHKAIAQSIIKYHDCIELCLMKRSNVDDKTDFDFNVGNFGVFLSHANVFKDDHVNAFYMHLYLQALRKYVEVMKYCQINNIKFSEGKMLEIDEKNEISVTNGQMVVYNISLFNESNANKLKECYPLNQSKVEIDVLTLSKNDLRTVCIVGDSVNGHLECEIYNGSMKTMLAKLFMLLQERWSQIGMDSVLVLRDRNLEREFQYLAELLGIECRLEDRLPSIDARFISTIKRTKVEDMDPKTLVLRLLEELGIDANNIQTVEATNEILEKLGNIKDEKKYN